MPGARTYRIGNTFPAFFQERTIYNRRSSCNTWTACPVTTRSAALRTKKKKSGSGGSSSSACPVTTRSAALRTNKPSGQRGSQWTTCPVSTRPAAIYFSMYVSIFVLMYLCIYLSMYLCIYVSIYIAKALGPNFNTKKSLKRFSRGIARAASVANRWEK